MGMGGGGGGGGGGALCKLLSGGEIREKSGKYDTLFKNVRFDLGPCSRLDLKYQ